MNGKLDEMAAQTSLNRLLPQLKSELAGEIAKLIAQRETMRAEPFNAQLLGQFYMHAHDLKGIAVPCGFPVIGQLAGRICALFDDPEHLPDEQMGLVDDHLDAIEQLLAAGVTSQDDIQAIRWLERLKQDVQVR